MNPQDMLLQQLRDIHGAPPVPWWPPAPGWWILAVLVLTALVLLGLRLRRALAARRRREKLLSFIELLAQVHPPANAPREYLAGINRVLKVVALRAFPKEEIAPLSGREWISFLSKKLPDEAELQAIEVLQDGPWQPEPQFDAGAIEHVARQWVLRHG